MATVAQTSLSCVCVLIKCQFHFNDEPVTSTVRINQSLPVWSLCKTGFFPAQYRRLQQTHSGLKKIAPPPSPTPQFQKPCQVEVFYPWWARSQSCTSSGRPVQICLVPFKFVLSRSKLFRLFKFVSSCSNWFKWLAPVQLSTRFL